MATHTDYFNLEKPESYENYNVEVFNDNAEIIDLQMHNNQVSAAKAMVGATSLADGESGRVPTPHAGDEDKFLKGDGTWAEAGSSNVEANPSGTPTDTLETIGIDNVIYQLPEGGNTEITGDEEGSIISIDDGKLNEPLKACTVDINPVQSGSGTPSPSNIRPISGWTEANITVAGTNVWDEEWEVGAYNVNGQPYLVNDRIRCKNPIPVCSNTTYFFCVKSMTVYVSIVYLDANQDSISTSIYQMNSGRTFTTPDNAAYMLWYGNDAYGTTYNNDISINYPSTDTSYHAYNGTTYNIEFEDSGSPLTVYGGTLDVMTGVLTVDRIKSSGKVTRLAAITSYENITYGAFVKPNDSANKGDTQIHELISTDYEISGAQSGWDDASKIGKLLVGADYNFFWIGFNHGTTLSDMQTITENNEIVYKLATPITYQLTPAQIITTLYGNNVIWADSGDIAITYVRDTSIAINDALNQSITPTYSSGTKIADYNIGGQTGAIYVQGAGGHMDTLWTGNETPTMSYNPTITLSHPISDYDFLLVNFNNYNGNFYLKSTVTLYGATVGDNFAQVILPSGYAAMFAHVINDSNITLNCYGGNYENTTTYVSIIGVKL